MPIYNTNIVVLIYYLYQYFNNYNTKCKRKNKCLNQQNQNLLF